MFLVAWFVPANFADEIIPDNDVIMRALVDEMNRSMELQMEDLEKPYFIQYSVDDAITYELQASYGALTDSQRSRSRQFYSQVRVGSFELDNTNFTGGEGGGFFFGGGGGSGGSASLPIDDDYLAIRQSVWWATDNDYKQAVETLTKKRAYMEDKTIVDRPNDFTSGEPIEVIEPGAELVFDRETWEAHLQKISAQFKKYDDIQDSSARLFVGAGNAFVVNSEGSRVRSSDAGALLVISAETQAEDGMKLTDSVTFSGDSMADLPPLDELLKEADEMVARLTKAASAPYLESYTGPVLFEGLAAAQMFRKMLASGVAGDVDPVGTQRRTFEGADNLEKKVGERILPQSFQVYDDPTMKKHGDTILFGHYRIDDQGVKARRVDIVKDGTLEKMVMSRIPTKKFSGSSGHGRRAPGGGSIDAAIGCLFISDDEGVSNDDLKKQLIEAAKEEGLEYGLRVAAIKAPGLGSSQSDIFAFFMRAQRGRQDGLGDPVYAYKVYVDDGREELVRGLEFGPIHARSLKRIVAAGTEQAVYNYIGIGFGGATPPSSIIAPSVLFEELEVTKIEEELDKLPILDPPLAREAS